MTYVLWAIVVGVLYVGGACLVGKFLSMSNPPDGWEDEDWA